MSTPRTTTPSTTTGTDVLLHLLIALAGLGMGGGSLAWLFGNLANVVVGSDPWAAYRPEETLLHPERVWPHLPQPAVITGCYVLPALVLLATAVVAAKVWLRFRSSPSGLATRRELALLLPRQIAAKAISLRPSLKGTKPKDTDPDDRGVLLGTLMPGKAEVRSSWEDVILAIMAPRSGKTSGLAGPHRDPLRTALAVGAEQLLEIATLCFPPEAGERIEARLPQDVDFRLGVPNP